MVGEPAGALGHGGTAPRRSAAAPPRPHRCRRRPRSAGCGRGRYNRIAALVLALLAGDGDSEFPGFSFEAGLLSRPPSSQAVEASDTPVLHAALAPDELAERLVEDPAFDPLPGARGGAMLPGAEPPAPPDATASSGANGGKDAVAVLSATSPPPADPTLRLLERLRLRSSIAGASRPAAALAAPASAKTEAAGSERGFAVQLLAAGRREQTVEAWGRLQRNNADLLGRLQPIIVEPERKVSNLFRLRAGPVASAREAQALCASLARRSVDCIVVQGGG